MADLQPCPFCGGEPELDTRQGYAQFPPNGRHGSRIAVYCRECGADIGVCREDVPDIEPEQVAEMWNRRAPAAEVGDLAALIRQLVHSLRKAAPSHALADRAADYLRRKGLQGSPLRAGVSGVSPSAGEGISRTDSASNTLPGCAKVGVEGETPCTTYCGSSSYQPGCATSFSSGPASKTQALTDEQIHALWVKHVGTHTSNIAFARALLAAAPPAAVPLTRLDELAKVYASNYASPHHFTMSVEGLRNLIEAAAVPGIPAGWQPIETAPKDGRWIQLFGRHPRGGCDQITARWWAPHAGDKGCWECGDDQYQPYLNPTHWQPLQPSPVAAAPAAPTKEPND